MTLSTYLWGPLTRFGLTVAGGVYGINVNRLTKNTHRDPIGTPLHRFVPCRIEAA